MVEEKLVSIITPVYNAEKYIENTIIKLKQQTYQNWEWLIVDDCSKDNTKEVIEKYTEKDSRIKYCKLEKNSGAGVARNKAIELAKGKYIALLDDDDYWDEAKLDKQIRMMEENNWNYSYTYHEKVDQDGTSLRRFYPTTHLTYKKALRYYPIHTSSSVYNVEKLDKIFFPVIRKRQDYGLMLKILEKTEGYVIPETLSYYVQREGSLSANKLNLVKYNWSLYRDYLNFGLIKSIYCLGWDIASKILKIK